MYIKEKKSLVLVASGETTFENVCSVACPFKTCQLDQGCERGVSSGLGSPSAPPPGPSRGEPGRARGCGTPQGRGPVLTQHPPASPTPGGATPLRPTPPTPPDPSYPAQSPPRTARSSGAFSRPRLLPASPARTTEHVTGGGGGARLRVRTLAGLRGRGGRA